MNSPRQNYSRGAEPDLLALLEAQAHRFTDRVAIGYIGDDGEPISARSFSALYEHATRVAAALQQRCQPGDRALLFFPQGIEFGDAFMGCVAARVVAVPAYLPPIGQGTRHLARIFAIASDARPALVLTCNAARPQLTEWLADSPVTHALEILAIDELAPDLAREWQRPTPAPEDTATIVYTSGSTSAPKGVMVRHANALHNLRMQERLFGGGPEATCVSWLPLYHDLGLMVAMLGSFYTGASCYLMSPEHFIQRPSRWLAAISALRARHSHAPNFAYDLCVRKVAPEECAGIDLSSWRVAINGAEPVRPATLQQFSSKFAPFGFRPQTFNPAYGMSEATADITACPVDAAPVITHFDGAALGRGEVVVVQPGTPGARALVSCGSTDVDQEIAIVDPATRMRCPPARVGEVWLSGPSICRSYWGRPEESAASLNAHIYDQDGSSRAGKATYLRTGDLGFLLGGALYLVGRLKDTIIIRGVNHAPQDIEASAESSHVALRPGCSAAVALEMNDEEVVAFVAEATPDHGDSQAIFEAIRQVVARDCQVSVRRIVLIEPRTLLKTTSGKIRRSAIRDALLARKLAVWAEVTYRPDVPGSGDEPSRQVHPGRAGDLVARLRALTAGEREHMVMELVRSEIAAVLGLPGGSESVDPDLPLHELGLDSLMAVDLRNRLQAHTGQELMATMALRFPEPRSLAAALLAGLASELDQPASIAAMSLPPVAYGRDAAPDPTMEVLHPPHTVPLSPYQARLWFLHQVLARPETYNVHVALRFDRALEPALLREALMYVILRHEQLRVSFIASGESARQRVLPWVEAEVSCHDLGTAPAAERAQALTKLSHEQARVPFNLSQPPLVRLSLVRIGPSESALLATWHHIVTDGTSVGIFLRELSDAYDILASGRIPSWSAAPSYLRYSEQALAWLETPRARAERDWWADQLTDLPILNLPTDHPEPGTRSQDGGVVTFELDSGLSAAVDALARETGITPFVVLLGAWSALLHRYSGQSDFAVGVSVAGRTRPGLEGVIGFFVNTLPIRCDASADPGAREYLRRLRDAVWAALDHQQLPLDEIVRVAAPRRNRHTSTGPLFRVHFVLDERSWTAGVFGRESVETLTRSFTGDVEGTAKFDLSLAMMRTTAGYRASLEYDAELYECTTIERMAAHLRVLLRAIIDTPEERISQLDLLTAGERHELLQIWNDTARPYPTDVCIHELFAAQAEKTPDTVAVVCEDRSLTYRELAVRAHQLAQHLTSLGVGPEVRVGVHAERSIEMVVALLGVLAAGGAYVPLEPGHPVERLRQIVEDAGLSLIVSERALDGWAGAGVRTVALEQEAEALARQPSTPPSTGVRASNLAYVIFTSGSTGRPKGAQNTHRAVCNRLVWMQELLRLGGADVVLQKTPFGFDVSVWEFFWPLMTGARLHLARPDGHKDPGYLRDIVAAAGITTMHFVPSMLESFLGAPGVETCADHLRQVICSGEALPRALERRFHERLPGVELYNLYGPTEAAIDVTWWRCLPSDSDGPIPIGRPVANTRTYVLDRAFNLVPPGVPGELFLAGVQVGRGYQGRPGLTAERFLPDPFSGLGERMYRTGDICRYRADGSLEFIGRADQQVKIRGFRIELGEIEAVLALAPGVARCAVLAREDSGGYKRLVAYVVGGEPLDPLVVRAHLTRLLPEYMVPAVFVRLDAMPLTASGKVDRKALPAPELDRDVAGLHHVPPRTPLEAQMAALWATVLGVEQVGVTDDFFALGGHSLLAVQIASRVRDALGLEVPLRTLFAAPTVARLCALLHVADAGLADAVPIEPVSRGQDLPLSFAQERLWFLDRLQPGSAHYNIPSALRLQGPLDRAALARALAWVVARHESLRTTFSAIDGIPRQHVAPTGNFSLDVEELSGLSPDQRQKTVAERTTEEARRPFDLETGPLFRARLLSLGSESCVLLVNMHHIVSDGWSLGILVRELCSAYRAYALGTEPDMPALPVQYVDYAAWQKRYSSDEALAGTLNYWRQKLHGVLPLELPTDRPRPSFQSDRGAHVYFSLPADLAARLESLAQAHQATLFMVLLATWQLLLSRYSGQDDIVVGTPVANRTRRETESLIGCFVNTLALRTDLSGDPTFASLLERVKSTALEAFDHQAAPFERVVEAAGAVRDASRTPLFQVMLVLQNTPAARFSLGDDLSVETLEVETGMSALDLTLSLTRTEHGLEGMLEYCTDLFEPVTIHRLAGHLYHLLDRIASAPDQRLSALSMLSPAEESTLLRGWNDTDRPYETDACIHHLVAAQARKTPDDVAVICGESSLTYAQLCTQANQLARRLASLGIGPEMRVGVYMDRSLDMVPALLAILQAGAAYVPLDPEYPSERLRFMARDACIAALLRQPGLPPIEGLGDIPQIPLDFAPPDEQAPAAPVTAVTADNLAYIIYTSGSTGTPKGVGVTHRSIVNAVTYEAEYLAIAPRMRVLQFAAIGFDTSVTQLFAPLMCGATVVVAAGRVRHDAGELAALIGASNVEIADLPPSMASLLPPAIRLRVLMVGGEVCPPALVERWAGLPRFVNAYGPTEATVTASYADCSADDIADGRLPPIGRPSANTKFYVLDRHLSPVPIGVPGELCIAGAGLARGYLGRPGLTAERFIPNPFAGAGERMYRTGDVVRYRENGKLEFLGRVDQQVKIRGFRIELGEIEAALSQAPGVVQCAVMARADTPGDRRLVAYVVLDDARVSASALREHLALTLPDYMVPAVFMTLDALPLASSGKVDRKALPAPEIDRALSGAIYIEPRTERERALAAIFGDVLGLARVGAHDDFFALGGHSLLAVRVISRVRDALGLDVPVRALFAAPTAARLAASLPAGDLRAAGVLPIPRVARDRVLPLSFAQERLWFLDRLQPGSAHYSMPGALRLEGPVDRDALAAALAWLIQRHEPLRTTFRDTDGVAYQYIAPREDSFVLHVEDLSTLDGEVRETLVRERVAAEACRPFDLAAGPLFRARLFVLSADACVLVLNMHHIVCDGWSVSVLIRELCVAYRSFAAGRAPDVPEPTLQYADYAVWQREHLSGEALERVLAYWRDTLRGAPPLELPTDRERPSLHSDRGAHLTMSLPLALTEALEGLARAHEATLFMVLLAAWKLLMSRYSGQLDVVVGTTVANREHQATEDLVGLFINMLALRTDLSGDPRFTELLERVKTTALAAYEHQAAPFERVVDALGMARDTSRTPLFQVVLVLQNTPPVTFALGEAVAVQELALETGTSKFDITISFTRTEVGLTGLLEYCTDLFEAATIKRLLGHLRTLLEEIATAPTRRLSELSVLSPAERYRLLTVWNESDRHYPTDVCLHASFAAQAARTPHATAVVYREQSLRYAELQARANQLAHHLRSLGVGPEVRVGVHMERSLEVVVAILGVINAGGVYVPLDPSYPGERLGFMVRDARLSMIITQSWLPALADITELPRLCIDVEHESLAARPATSPEIDVSAQNLAYIIYTSGSTGQPKGVGVSHAGLPSLIGESARIQGFGPGRSLLSFASIAFDGMVFEVWSALCTGTTLVMTSHDERLSERALSELLSKVDIAVLPPRVLASLSPDAVSPGLSLAVAGEACPRELAAVWSKHCQLFNLYGPTESSVTVTAYQVRGDEDRPPPIGRPIANTRVYVLDRELQPAPIGVPGELYVAGVGLARGYIGQPGMTAERFVPDPFAGPGERMYRTGDICRYRADGNLEFIGRADHQVKIRGFRIELGEVESAIARLAWVEQCAVLAREDRPGDRRLVAYVVGAPDGHASGDHETSLAATLRGHLAEILPDYMVPAAFVHLAELPLTPSGKVDRASLPAPGRDRDHAGPAYVTPRNRMESLLADVWAEVLEVPRVGVHDDFFALGGHSLLAVQVISRVRAALGLEVPVRALFAAPTVARLAASLAAGDPRAADALPIPRAARDRALPLSFAQERMWLLEQRRRPDSPPRNTGGALRLTGPLNRRALASAVTWLVQRHESLRTTITGTDANPMQQISHDSVAFALELEDLPARADIDREEFVRERAIAEMAYPFDLRRGPLFRARLLVLSPDSHVLLVTVHHIVFDGWSMGILVRELSAAYQAYDLTGQAPQIPDLLLQYADYAVWQRERLSGDALERLLAYWRDRLRDSPLLALPVDHVRSAPASDHGASVPVTLSAELSERLAALARERKATLFMVLLAAWKLLLGHHAGQADIVVGTPIAGRTHRDIEGLIGCFINMLALRTDLSGNPSFSALLERVKATTLEAYEHQEAPLERVIDAVCAARDTGRRPLFQVMMILQNAPAADFAFSDDISTEPLAFDSPMSRFELTLSFTQTEAGLRGVLRYATDLFRESTASRLVEQLQRLLEAVVNAPERAVSDLLEQATARSRTRPAK